MCSERSNSSWFSNGILFFRYNPQKFACRDEDDSDMEANFDDIMREEKRRSVSLSHLWQLFANFSSSCHRFSKLQMISLTYLRLLSAQCKNCTGGGWRAAALVRGGGEAWTDEKDGKKAEGVLKQKFFLCGDLIRWLTIRRLAPPRFGSMFAMEHCSSGGDLRSFVLQFLRMYSSPVDLFLYELLLWRKVFSFYSRSHLPCSWQNRPCPSTGRKWSED